MVLPTLARRLLKAGLFLFVGAMVMIHLDNPGIYVNHQVANKNALFIAGDINAESIYDTYFYIDIICVVAITIAAYLIAINLIIKIRKY
ncbi:hypothetical protein [Enterobacter sp. Ap-1006]|uniref:hypothetical protein n=1 Tax=Enterobacter sp. Ap-1006 TaxID=2608345 RepID=UPI0014205234